jgi:hypothetical protein
MYIDDSEVNFDTSMFWNIFNLMNDLSDGWLVCFFVVLDVEYYGFSSDLLIWSEFYNGFLFDSTRMASRVT